MRFSVLGTPSWQTVGLLDGCKRKLLALSNSAELDEAEEARHNGAAPTKLVPIPILSHPRSNSSGLFIKILTKRLVISLLGKVYLGFKPAGVFRACGRDQRNFLGKFLWTLQTFLIRLSLYSSELSPANKLHRIHVSIIRTGPPINPQRL